MTILSLAQTPIRTMPGLCILTRCEIISTRYGCLSGRVCFNSRHCDLIPQYIDINVSPSVYGYINIRLKGCFTICIYICEYTCRECCPLVFVSAESAIVVGFRWRHINEMQKSMQWCKVGTCCCKM